MATYTVDGVSLDHPAGCWKLLSATQVRPFPGVRAASVSVPGRPGELPITGEDVEATTVGLTLGVTGLDPSGRDRGAAGLDANLAALYGLFGVRHRLLDVRYTPAPEMAELQAEATVVAAAEPTVWMGAARARLPVVLRIPGVYWREVAPSTWSTRTLGAPVRVTAFDGSTAPVLDAILRITGPVTDLRITDMATGGWVSYPGTLAATRALRLHCGRMDAHEAASIAWDGTGANATGRIVTGGPGSGFRFLALTPAAVTSAHDRGVRVLVEGTGTSEATLIELRARRAFL
ncbi:hypothetical protein GCM10012275_39750 [Longimycelium tulufanense]|uniref:Uncharacterized protein n=1 Tax=Longimycelium tulufanense TaxID=907463 RepID=A0A8J3CDZ7_9PSEU|nr:hypothetical protein [Longimycelium tulufanense]GGM65236.1 hypothetical protein GCM10012275_39750 [Longimycelium tulufanense]